MSEWLNRQHNLISLGQEALPARLIGRPLMAYLPERDVIVLAGWEENTGLLAELAAAYLELTPGERETVQETRPDWGTPGLEAGLWRTLDGIYDLRHGPTTS